MATFKQYTATGGATEPFSIPSFTSDEIKIRVEDVLKVAATHYTIEDYTFNGGTVTWTSGNVPSNGTKVRIYRDTVILNNAGSDVEAKAIYNAGSAFKAGSLNDNQKQALRALEEQDQLIQSYEIEDNAITTAKMGADSLQTLADQVTASEPDWLTNLGVVAGNLGEAVDYGLVSETASTVDTGSIDTVAASIDDINRYAEEYKIASSAPSGASEGDLWYDTTTNALKVYAGSTWVVAASETESSLSLIDEDNFASNSATRPPSQQSVKAYVDALNWLDQSTKEDGSVIYWKDSATKYYADNAQNIKTLNGGNF